MRNADKVIETKVSCVYAIRCPKSNLYVYVGQTHDFKIRKYQHLSRRSSTEISKWIARCKDNKISPIFEILEKCDTEVLLKKEREWFLKLTESGYILLNLKSLKEPKNNFIARKKGIRINEDVLDHLLNNPVLRMQLLTTLNCSGASMYKYLMTNDSKLTCLSILFSIMRITNLPYNKVLVDYQHLHKNVKEFLTLRNAKKYTS